MFMDIQSYVLVPAARAPVAICHVKYHDIMVIMVTIVNIIIIDIIDV